MTPLYRRRFVTESGNVRAVKDWLRFNPPEGERLDCDAIGGVTMATRSTMEERIGGQLSAKGGWGHRVPRLNFHRGLLRRACC
jgi:hypothetical protein